MGVGRTAQVNSRLACGALALALFGAALPAGPVHAASSGAPAATALGDVLTDIAFIRPQVGYGYFVRRVQGECQAEVASTHNGGALFGPLVEVTKWGCNGNAPVRYLAFDGHGDGFLYGPALFVTHNGGRTWASGQVPGSVLSVQARGQSVWAVTAKCASPGARQCQLALFKSADGGRDWARSTLPRLAANPYMGDMGQVWLERAGASTAYLLGTPLAGPAGDGSEVPMWATANGGASWAAHQVQCHIQAIAASMSVAPDGTLFVACASDPSAGFEPKSVLRSTDGGQNWAVEVACNLVPKPSPGCSSSVNNGYLAGIAATSTSSVFLYGERSSLLVSRDGGAEWGPVRPLIGDTGGDSGPAVFFDRHEGSALGSDPRNNEAQTIWATSDGGVHWNAVVPHIDVPGTDRNGEGSSVNC